MKFCSKLANGTTDTTVQNTTQYILSTGTDYAVWAIDVEAPDPRNAIVTYIKR